MRDKGKPEVVFESFGLMVYREPVESASERWRFEVAGQRVSAICDIGGLFALINALLKAVGAEEDYQLYKRVTRP